MMPVPGSGKETRMHQQLEFLLLAIIGYYCNAIIANNSD
jgi:hypothetical protein